MDNRPTTAPHYDLGVSSGCICLVAALGGLLFGYDWVVIGGAKPFYEPFFRITDATPLRRGWAQSSAVVRLSDRRDHVGGPQRPVWPQAALDPGGAPVHPLGGWHRPGRPLRGFQRLPHPRWPGDRSGVEPFAHVHRRSQSGHDARAVCFDQSADDRHWDPGGADRQLADRRTGILGSDGGGDPGIVERPDRLAVDVLGRDGAGGALLSGDVLRAGEPAVAGEVWPQR